MSCCLNNYARAYWVRRQNQTPSPGQDGKIYYSHLCIIFTLVKAIPGGFSVRIKPQNFIGIKKLAAIIVLLVLLKAPLSSTAGTKETLGVGQANKVTASLSADTEENFLDELYITGNLSIEEPNSVIVMCCSDESKFEPYRSVLDAIFQEAQGVKAISYTEIPFPKEYINRGARGVDDSLSKDVFNFIESTRRESRILYLDSKKFMEKFKVDPNVDPNTSPLYPNTFMHQVNRYLSLKLQDGHQLWVSQVTPSYRTSFLEFKKDVLAEQLDNNRVCALWNPFSYTQKMSLWKRCLKDYDALIDQTMAKAIAVLLRQSPEVPIVVFVGPHRKLLEEILQNRGYNVSTVISRETQEIRESIKKDWTKFNLFGYGLHGLIVLSLLIFGYRHRHWFLRWRHPKHKKGRKLVTYSN